MKHILFYMKYIPLILLLGGYFGLSVLAAGNDKDSAIAASVPDFEAQTFAGDPVRLSDFRGDIVLLNFWASWCFPCRYEMPHFAKLYDTFKDQGFKVVAVAVYDEYADAKAFQDKYQFPFSVVFDHAEEAKNAFDIKVVPQTFLIGRDSKLIPIPNPKTGKKKLKVNDPTIWEQPETVTFLQHLMNS